MIPAVTEMLFAIGAGDEVVGVSSFDTYPPEVKSRTKVGALIDPDFERILSLRPDLVAVYESQAELMTRLERANIPVFRYEHAGLADITRTIRALGARVGRAPQAEGVARQVELELESVRKAVAGKKRPRTAVLIGREPGTLRNIYASAGVGFLHDMLETAGGEDVFGDVKRQSLQATSEVLLARAPEVIIEIHSTHGWTAEKAKTELRAWQALPSLPAVRNSQVHVIADERFWTPGPRVAEAVRLIANTLHPR